MLDAFRKYIEAGREALTPRRAEELARSLAREGQARRDQVTKTARDLLDWSRKSSDRFRDSIRREVTRQIGRAGLATSSEVETLKRRIRKLEAERSTSSRKSTAGTSTRAPTRKSPSTRKPASRKRTTASGR